jgi:hypothetical protein
MTGEHAPETIKEAVSTARRGLRLLKAVILDAAKREPG